MGRVTVGGLILWFQGLKVQAPKRICVGLSPYSLRWWATNHGIGMRASLVSQARSGRGSSISRAGFGLVVVIPSESIRARQIRPRHMNCCRSNYLVRRFGLTLRFARP
jgi:hypothetical protein